MIKKYEYFYNKYCSINLMELRKCTSHVCFHSNRTYLDHDAALVVTKGYIVGATPTSDCPDSLQSVVERALQAVGVGMPDSNRAWGKKIIYFTGTNMIDLIFHKNIRHEKNCVKLKYKHTTSCDGVGCKH